MIEIPQTVKVRRYKIDNLELCNLLRDSKNKKRISNKQIAEQLHIPLTQVEHWFRTDSCFAIPDENIWLKLKQLLNIQTNEYDLAITTFDYYEGVYEKSHRAYYYKGIAPTITTHSEGEKIIVERK